jgi:spermidine/putrescine transport system substrate-binding protein
MARRIDRRELLQGGAGLAIAAGLAGCGVATRAAARRRRPPIKKRVDGDLVYFNYSEYIDPDLVKGFEKRYGVKVREPYFDSMSAMTAKLRAGIEYDVIFPSAECAQRLIEGTYSMYMTGLGYRTDKVTGTWRDLGEADSQDRSFLLDDYQKAVGMANLGERLPTQ